MGRGGGGGGRDTGRVGSDTFTVVGASERSVAGAGGGGGREKAVGGLRPLL